LTETASPPPKQRQFSGERRVFSTSGAGTTRYPHAKNKTKIRRKEGRKEKERKRKKKKKGI